MNEWMNECINHWFKICTSDVLHQVLPGIFCGSSVSLLFVLAWCYNVTSVVTWVCHDSKSYITMNKEKDNILVTSSLLSLLSPSSWAVVISKVKYTVGPATSISFLPSPLLRCEVKTVLQRFYWAKIKVEYPCTGATAEGNQRFLVSELALP